MLFFPSAVKIRNVRLELCRNFLLMLVVILMVANVLVFANFTLHYPITGHVQTSVTGFHDWDALSGADSLAQTSSVCTNTTRYSFWPSPDGSIRYDNFSCLSPCPPGRTAANCIASQRLFFQEGSQSSVIVTSLQKTILEPTSAISNTTQRYENYLTPAAEALSVDILYTMKMGKIEMSSFFDTTTVVLNSEGTPWKRFASGKGHVSISLSDLLTLSGASLEDTLPVVGRNYFPQATDTEGPTARVAGTNLDIEVVCGRTPRRYFWEQAALPTEARPDVECTLKVQRSPSFLVSLTRLEPVPTSNGGITVNTYQGVRFTSSFQGKYKKLDLNAILVNLTTSLTFLAIPNQVVIVFALGFLGHLSSIYKKAVHKEFNISKECAAMSIRLIAHSYLFSEVQNQMAKDGKFENGIIDDVSMTQMWMRVIKDHISTPTAAEEMAQFFMHQIVTSFKTPPLGKDDYKSKGVIQGIWQEVQDGFNAVATNLDYSRALKKYASGGHDEKLNMESFQAAFCSADPISFDSLVRLFDQNRPVAKMEQFFTPVQLRICLEKAKHDILIKEQRQKAEEALYGVAPPEDAYEGDPHDDYVSARFEISRLQEELLLMRQNMSEAEERLVNVTGAFNEQGPNAKVVSKRIDPASGLVSRVQFDRQCLQIMEVVDRRLNDLKEECRSQRDEMRAGMDAIAGSALSKREGSRSPPAAGAAGGGVTRFSPPASRASSRTNQITVAPAEARFARSK